jgi:hypothetical protein
MNLTEIAPIDPAYLLAVVYADAPRQDFDEMPEILDAGDFPIDEDPLADMSYIERDEILDEMDREHEAWQREQFYLYN